MIVPAQLELHRKYQGVRARLMGSPRPNLVFVRRPEPPPTTRAAEEPEPEIVQLETLSDVLSALIEMYGRGAVYQSVEDDRQRIAPPFVSLKDINKLVCEKYRIPFVEILSPRRHSRVVRARQVAMYLAKVMTIKSLPEIGKALRRDHTTVLHGVRKIAALIDRDPKLAEQVAELRRQLEPAPAPIIAGNAGEGAAEQGFSRRGVPDRGHL